MTDEPFLLLKTTNEFLAWRNKVLEPIGLVPTMGNLHPGHLTLVERSLLNNPMTVVPFSSTPNSLAPKKIGTDIQEL